MTEVVMFRADNGQMHETRLPRVTPKVARLEQIKRNAEDEIRALIPYDRLNGWPKSCDPPYQLGNKHQDILHNLEFILMTHPGKVAKILEKLHSDIEANG